jgi:16S rRNA (guanine527-N7)-methyltransferase
MIALKSDVNNLLGAYRELLLSANEKLNLVSRRDVHKHVAVLIPQSLLPLSWSICRMASPMVDIGSGGGLPGIPLKIARPELEITLLDSNRRKTLFLRIVVERLGLEKVTVVWSRAEEYSATQENRFHFRTVVARGLGAVDDLLGWADDLLMPGGELIIWTSEHSIKKLAKPESFSAPSLMKVAPGLNLVRFAKRD